MAENKWVVDGHHYTCPNCKKTIAIVVNESDDGFEFCPFCGKRMSGQTVKNKLEEIVDLLAEYGGFNREYLRDKLLTSTNGERSKTKKEVAAFQMAFPDTWEEFENHYGFYDIKEVYTFGNLRLIPSFRVQQWLNHLDDINLKKQSQKNKMEQIAKMFGKELEEEFCVSCCNTRFLLKFTFDGLWVFDDSWGHWNGEDGMLEALLRGEAVIVDD